jgi:ribulose-phosphate 3-epimerase
MGVSRVLADLHGAVPVIGPSLLGCDFGRLADEVQRLEQAGARVFHLDIMDGHFVPNLSFGLPVVEAVRRATTSPLDVHLMISAPGRYVEEFREAGADLITIHIEAVPEPGELLETIRKLGAGAGLTLNPYTPVTDIEPYLDLCDLVLVMSVNPGFGGQQFHPEALDKLRWLRDRVRSDVLLSVDGGVNPTTIGDCARAGADLFVVGTALLNHSNYRQRLAELTALVKSIKDVEVQP